MYYVKMKKPISCETCKLAYTHTVTGEDYCCALGREVDYQSIDKDCPIKELKPKKLIWDKVDKMKVIAVLKLACTDVLVVHIAKTPVGNIMIFETLGNKIVIDAPMLTYHFYQAKELLDSRQNVENAKQFCQEHYNRVFNEMLGD